MYGVPDTFISVEEYWEYLQISECQGYGIRNVPDEVTTGCPDYWNQDERYWIASAIAKTEKRLLADRWLGFPIRRQYEKPRQMPYVMPLIWGKYLRGIGVEREVLVEEDAAITLSNGSINDPVTLSVTVDFTDENELVIYYPDQTKYAIRPSAVSISGNTATITIPRCRLLKPAYFKDYDQVVERPDYEDDDNFLAAVDVYRNYLDTTTGANLVWYRTNVQARSRCNFNSCIVCFGSSQPGVGSDVKQTAAGYVREQRMGEFTLEPADYDAATNTWTRKNMSVCRMPDLVEVNAMRFYYDRYEAVDEHLMRAVVAVAHNNLPEDYCSCSVQKKYFEDDTKPLEPAVSLGLGPSTWGIYEAAQIISQEFDMVRQAHMGGFLG